jgi:hypothetical protein
MNEHYWEISWKDRKGSYPYSFMLEEFEEACKEFKKLEKLGEKKELVLYLVSKAVVSL